MIRENSISLANSSRSRGSRREDQRGVPYASYPIYPGIPQPTSSGPPSGNVMSPWGSPTPQQPNYQTNYPNTTSVGTFNTQWSSSYAPQGYSDTYPPVNSGTTPSYGYVPLDPQQPPDESHKGPYKCRWCERVFAHESSKCRHEKEHFNSFPCPEPGCDVVSSRKDSLKRHQRLMHGGGEGGSQGSSSRSSVPGGQ